MRGMGRSWRRMYKQEVTSSEVRYSVSFQLSGSSVVGWRFLELGWEEALGVWAGL
jgi:hypothetical protein